jgi:hypothetical protein
VDVNSLSERVSTQKLLCLKGFFSSFDLCVGAHVSTPKTTQFRACISVSAVEETAELANQPTADVVARAG